uniref:SBP-type domain-containing protein n=1 Tax=Kalanchoe fedtschenkoi TaxID=63787 RepID=A0A7N0T023_KALFE
MARKRDLPYQQQELMIDQPHHPSGGLNSSRDYWSSNRWNWDCTRFVAQQVDGDAMNLDAPVQSIQNKININQVAVEDDGSLCLKLGSGSGGSSSSDEPALRPSKRVAGGNNARSPGGSGNGNHTTCQVDSCMVDLSIAKDYHRRHKVCEAHSKATQALVGKQMQRFCQQCSRFHVLSEFDEGKRSCRRRLAGHNRRRRKTQPDDVTSRLWSAGGQENAVNTGLDLVSLLAALARAQGNQDNANCVQASVPGKEQLIQLISKINSFSPPSDAATKLPVSDKLEKTNVEASPEHQSGSSANSSSQSTLNLLGVLPLASPVSAPDAFTAPSQRSSHSSDSEKTKSADTYQPDPRVLRKRTILDFSSVGGERSCNSSHYPAEDSNSHVHDAQVNLPLQLFFSSPEDNNSPPKMADSSKYFSSDSSNQNEERSPSCSPGVQLFPVKPSKLTLNNDRIPNGLNAKTQAGKSPCGTVSFDLFGGSKKGVEVDFCEGSPNQVGYASPVSAYSPSSSTCGTQDLTGRILFKLFDKDPSHLPVALRSEILAWLSNSPSQMESYIRPGCVVLSVYVSMPSSSWEQLEENLLEQVSRLLQRTDIDIWRDGRFLVQTGKQLASHNNGKLRLCKSWITPKAPELVSVSPLAIVGGHETRVHLRGRNLNCRTKIHCTYMGGYITKDICNTAVHDCTCDRTSLCGCEIHIAAPSGTGRCFIEVDNGFKGNSHPIIIADSTICQELRQLEFEFETDPRLNDAMSEVQESDVLRPKAEVLHFLNELGWLFQTKDSSNTLEYSIYRFKFLLIFSVEKDFFVLVKKLLDILVEEKLGGKIPMEVSEMVSGIQLLHRAVKRRCRKMVDMLVNYSIVSRDPKLSKIYVFPPNCTGPGGLTPLHIAACTSGLEDVVDALTNDPTELGLCCWESQLDESGQSPYAYATLRNNLSYNRLVAQKLADRRNNQISLSVEVNETMEQAWVEPSPAASHVTKHKAGSCSQCAAVVARCSNRRRVPGSHGMVGRPFILSMLAVAAVCVCVCLYFRGYPYTGMVSPFTWEKLDYATI